MSRSALWRQEGAKKEREKQAEELFQLAVDEGRVRHFFCFFCVCVCNVGRRMGQTPPSSKARVLLSFCL
jgi:hypothetical protein